MKQKILIQVSMHDDKSRAKAMNITVGLSGVQSVALKGDDKNQIEVTGDDVDVIGLTISLRKKVGYAELVSVSKVEPPKQDGDKKPEGDKKPDGEKKQEQPYVCVWPHGHGMPYNQYQVCVGEPNYYQEPSCTIM